MQAMAKRNLKYIKPSLIRRACYKEVLLTKSTVHSDVPNLVATLALLMYGSALFGSGV